MGTETSFNFGRKGYNFLKESISGSFKVMYHSMVTFILCRTLWYTLTNIVFRHKVVIPRFVIENSKLNQKLLLTKKSGNRKKDRDPNLNPSVIMCFLDFIGFFGRILEEKLHFVQKKSVRILIPILAMLTLGVHYEPLNSN